MTRNDRLKNSCAIPIRDSFHTDVYRKISLIEMTMRYAHLSPDVKRTAVAGLQEFFEENGKARKMEPKPKELRTRLTNLIYAG